MKASPASDHLYKVQDLILSNLLPKEQAWAFHHDFAQVSEWQGTQRYTAGRGILDNQSQSSRQRLLGKSEMRPWISQRDATYATYFVGGFTDFGAMVGGCSVCHAQQLLGTYWGRDELGTRNGPELLVETED